MYLLRSHFPKLRDAIGVQFSRIDPVLFCLFPIIGDPRNGLVDFSTIEGRNYRSS